MAEPFTREQVERFVAAWYLALDQHDAFDSVYALLADRDLEVRFPDGVLRDQASAATWYDSVTHRYFDENHFLHRVETISNGDTADVRVVVGWQASMWEPPAAKSRRVSLDATQTWTVRRSSKNAYGLEIVTYNATAEPFQYTPGFARL